MTWFLQNSAANTLPQNRIAAEPRRKTHTYSRSGAPIITISSIREARLGSKFGELYTTSLSRLQQPASSTPEILPSFDRLAYNLPGCILATTPSEQEREV